jgi:hypothetical protein
LGAEDDGNDDVDASHVIVSDDEDVVECDIEMKMTTPRTGW